MCLRWRYMHVCVCVCIHIYIYVRAYWYIHVYTYYTHIPMKTNKPTEEAGSLPKLNVVGVLP